MLIETNGEVKIVLNGETIWSGDILTLDTLKRVAKDRSIKKFYAISNGEELSTADFPIEEGVVEIKPYYEAK